MSKGKYRQFVEKIYNKNIFISYWYPLILLSKPDAEEHRLDIPKQAHYLKMGIIKIIYARWEMFITCPHLFDWTVFLKLLVKIYIKIKLRLHILVELLDERQIIIIIIKNWAFIISISYPLIIIILICYFMRFPCLFYV